jgi:tRNA(fMet)-specific endonuclease VapC
VILDTNAISALAAREAPLLERLRAVDTLALSFISVAEFRFGLLGSNRPEQGLELLNQLIARIPTLYPDAATVGRYSQIADDLKRTGRPIPQNDMWTAALALQHVLPVVSRDRHFDFVPGIDRLHW